jgi:hypothetical protein
VAAAAPAAPRAEPGIAIAAEAQLFWVDRGRYHLTIAPMQSALGVAGGMSLPSVQVVTPNAGDPSAVEIIGEPEANWIGSGGGTIVVRSPPEGGHLLVTAYTLPDQPTSPLEIDLQPVDDDPSGETSEASTNLGPRLEIVLHIERAGDRRFAGAAWAGRLGSRLRIEAMAVYPIEVISRGEIEYKVFTHGGRETPWVANGQLCGTRGQSLALTGFAVRLAPQLRDRFDIVYRGAFFNSGPGPFVSNGQACVAPLPSDPLEAVEIRIVER